MGLRSPNKPVYEKIGARDAFDDFQAKHENKEITFRIYKEIILKFLTIYINELLFLNQPMYFLFGGKVMLNRCGGFIDRDKSNKKVQALKVLKEFNNSLGFFWHERPIQTFKHVKLAKLAGSTNRLPILCKEWIDRNDILKLYTSRELKKKKKFLKIYGSNI